MSSMGTGTEDNKNTGSCMKFYGCEEVQNHKENVNR
jgi:hypothetical protein